MNGPARQALVTGFAGGLGKALTEQLLAEGWTVTGIDIDGKRGLPDGLTAINCDLSERDALDDLLAGDRLKGPFDLVVLNAAVSASGRFENIPLKAHLKLLRLNAEAPMVMSASLASGGGIASGGYLVFVSSLSHVLGYPGAASYAASKDAIAVYAKSIRKPFARRGIKVSCVFPGPMQTDQAEKHSPAGSDAQKRMTPQMAAKIILRNVRANRRVIIPSASAKSLAFLGRLFPAISDRVMRRMLFEKLDRDVW